MLIKIVSKSLFESIVMAKIPSAGLDLRNYFLFWKDVIALTGKSEMTIRRAIKRNEFPSPVKLFPGGRSVAFSQPDIYLWIEGRWFAEGGM